MTTIPHVPSLNLWDTADDATQPTQEDPIYTDPEVLEMIAAIDKEFATILSPAEQSYARTAGVEYEGSNVAFDQCVNPR